jgi:hypothetical protein
MKKKLLLLAALAVGSASSYGQTTLFFDNFDPIALPTNNASANNGFAASALTGSVSDALGSYTGFTTATAGFYLASANGTSGLNCIWNATSSTYSTNLNIQSISTAASTKGTSTIAMPLSKISAPFSSVLKNNTDVITWSFGMRINKSTILGPLPAGLKPGAGLTGGMILATDCASDQAIAGSAASGYVVLLSGNAAPGTTNRIDFGSFTGGLNDATFTSLLTVDNITAGGNAISVTVTYTPSSNTWTLKARQDGSASIVDPDATTTASYVSSTPSSVVDSDYTGMTMANMMLFYNHNTTNGIYVDNLRVKTNATLGIAKNEISGLNVYPNPVTNGKVFITSSNSEVKKVAVYDVLGKQLIQKEVSNEALNVSSLKKGIYVMKITEGAASSTKKLIIE